FDYQAASDGARKHLRLDYCFVGVLVVRLAAMTPYSKGLTLLTALLLALSPAARAQTQDTVGSQWTYDTPDARFRVEVIAAGLETPVGMSFLPDGRLLIADRPTS